MTHPTPLWRSQLIVPVNVEGFVAKAHLRGADAIILDLEDSITPPEKAAARALVPEAVRRAGAGGAAMMVRINQPLQLAVRDIEAVVDPAVAALVLPKVDSAGHVRLLAQLVADVERERGMTPGHTRFVVLIETAPAWFRMQEIAASHPRVAAMSLGSEDFSMETGSEPDPDVLLGPKQQVVIACAAAGILPMGVIGSIANYRDIEGYTRAIAQSRRFGFRGASCIHPDIVPLLNAGFAPTAAELDSARRIVAAFEQATAEGRGALSVDGRMIDIPVVLRARKTLDIAGRIARRDGDAATGGPSA
jgi:citrate lyase subunit beta / citryl-CoA lyase